jgi:hypothetical protein
MDKGKYIEIIGDFSQKYKKQYEHGVRNVSTERKQFQS